MSTVTTTAATSSAAKARKPITIAGLTFHESCEIENREIFQVERCSCKPTAKGKCTDDSCPNVYCSYECPPECKCDNRPISNTRNFPKVSMRVSPVSGNGLYADEGFGVGRRIINYDGEVISVEEQGRRKAIYNSQGLLNYFYDTGCLLIDPTMGDHKAKYANHSCDPNMRAEAWAFDGLPEGFHITSFVSIKPVKRGDELTFNYGASYDVMNCLCGSENCSGKAGKKENVGKDAPKSGVLQKKSGNTSGVVAPSSARRALPPRHAAPKASGSGSSGVPTTSSRALLISNAPGPSTRQTLPPPASPLKRQRRGAVGSDDEDPEWKSKVDKDLPRVVRPKRARNLIADIVPSAPMVSSEVPEVEVDSEEIVEDSEVKEDREASLVVVVNPSDDSDDEEEAEEAMEIPELDFDVPIFDPIDQEDPEAPEDPEVDEDVPGIAPTPGRRPRRTQRLPARYAVEIGDAPFAPEVQKDSEAQDAPEAETPIQMGRGQRAKKIPSRFLN